MKIKISTLIIMLSSIMSTAALAQDAALPQVPTVDAEPVLMRDGAVAGHESLHRGLSAGQLEIGQESAWTILQPSSFHVMFAHSLGNVLRWTGLDVLDAQGQLSPLGALHSQVVDGCERWFGLMTTGTSTRYRVSSRFGKRFHPILKKWKLHNGIDYAAPTGTPVHAAASGVIKSAGWAGPGGKVVVIAHDDGYMTGYAHLHTISKKITPGQKVRVGEVIGAVGTTGRSTGPHLHFTVRKDGVYVDPLAAKGFAYNAPLRRISDFELAYRKEIRPVLLSLLKPPAQPVTTASR